MTSRDSASSEITPEVLLRAYACGIFPMAESSDDPTLFWVEPEMRGVIPLDGFRISSRLARTVRSDAFTVTASSMATVQGAPDYAFLTTAHPVAILSPEAVAERAEQLLPQVLATVTDPAGQRHAS